jgi:3-methyladenine DNA glycosylase AlkD
VPAHPPHAYAKLLYDRLAAHRHPESIAPMRASMHNEFDFFGINTPERRVLLSEHVVEHGLPPLSSLERNARLLWKLPERECQHCAQELLEKRVSELTLDQIPLLEFMITHKSRWDTVDFIATKLIGPLLQREVQATKWTAHTSAR